MNSNLSKANSISHQLLLDESLNIQDVIDVSLKSLFKVSDFLNTNLKEYVLNKKFLYPPYNLVYSGLIKGHKVFFNITPFNAVNLYLCTVYHITFSPYNHRLSFDYYLAINTKGDVIDVDHDFVEKFIYSINDVIGKDIFTFIHPDYVASFKNFLQCDTHESKSLKLSFVNSFGSVVVCEIISFDVSSVDGIIKYLLLKDVTDYELNSIIKNFDVNNIINAFNILNVPVFVTDMFGRLTESNDCAKDYCRLFTFNFSQLIALSEFDFVRALYDFSLSKKSNWTINITYNSLDGVTSHFILEIFLISDSFFIPNQFVVVLKENNLKHVYHILNKSLCFQDSIYLWIFDNKLNCVYSNRNTGLLDFLNFEPHLSLDQYLDHGETKVVCKNDKLYTLSVTKTIHDNQQFSVVQALITSDSSQLELLNKELNIEKKFLIKELQHRVRNNIQTILSIVNLNRTKHLDNKLVTGVYNDILSRLYSISSLNDFIYLKDSSIHQLINNIFEINRSIFANTSVILECRIFDFKFRNSLKVNYFGMMINELISNSFKHGFVSDSILLKKITINIVKLSDHLSFQYNDNGIGFQTNDSETIGLSLIDSFLSNLEVFNKTEETVSMYALKFSFYE